LKKLLFLMVALVCISYSQAYADYSFSFTDTNGLYNLQGTLLTSLNGAGPLAVTGGYGTGNGSLNMNSTYTLLAAGTYVNTDGNGANLQSNNVLTPGSNPVLDGYGLVFQVTDGTGSIINIWGNSADNYTYWKSYASNGSVNGEFNITPLTATPIPAAAWLFGSGLMGLVGIRKKLV